MLNIYDLQSRWRNRVDFEDIKGSVYLGSHHLSPSVSKYRDDQLFIYTTKGIYCLYHEGDCCETVSLTECDDFLDSAIGEVISVAEERTKKEDLEYGSCTWTFYAIRTMSMDVDMTWQGVSNGFYSEAVDIAKIPWTPDLLKVLDEKALVALDKWMEEGNELDINKD